jgi:hypothetical protein
VTGPSRRGEPMVLPCPPSLALQNNRDRSVVHELHLHPGTENAPRHVDAVPLERFAEDFVERLGSIRPGGAREARSVSLACVGDQRELADDKRSAARIEHAAVEFSLLVLEDPQPRDLAGEPSGGRLVVLVGNAEQDAEPALDRADVVPVDEDAGGANALNDRFQLSSASSAFRYSWLCGRKKRASR